MSSHDPLMQRALRIERTTVDITRHIVADIRFRTGEIACACGWAMTSPNIERDWKAHRKGFGL